MRPPGKDRSSLWLSLFSPSKAISRSDESFVVQFTRLPKAHTFTRTGTCSRSKALQAGPDDQRRGNSMPV